jgi:hypothetical protein
MGLHIIESFCTTKEMVSKLKRPPTEWVLHIRQRTDNQNRQGSKKPNSPQINEPIKTFATELNKTFSKEEIQMAKNT